MPKEIERKIAYDWYVEKHTVEDILKQYNIRKKTLQVILGKYKDEFDH